MGKYRVVQNARRRSCKVLSVPNSLLVQSGRQCEFLEATWVKWLLANPSEFAEQFNSNHVSPYRRIDRNR